MYHNLKLSQENAKIPKMINAKLTRNFLHFLVDISTNGIFFIYY